MTDLMRQTQSNTSPGNCWQTAVACILGVPASDLPDQVAIEAAKESYLNALIAYLDRHHDLMYTEIEEYQIGGLAVREPGWHVLIGPTARTEQHGNHHAVVGRYGEQVWDPHPSRAGLLRVIKWGVLVPVLDSARESRRVMAKNGHWKTCQCPKCK